MERNDRHTEYNPEQEMTRTGDEKPIGAVGQRERRPKSRAARAAQEAAAKSSAGPQSAGGGETIDPTIDAMLAGLWEKGTVK